MLRGLRKAGQSWLGKVVVALLFGLLIVSFAIWGIGDIFRGAPRNTVAVIGKTEISAEQFRTAYQNELQRLIRQTRQSITPDQARAFGIDRQILSRLVTEATLDQRARELGLGISNETVARTIMEDQNFKGANGQFDRRLFENILRDNGLNEPAFVRDQRAVITRLQIADAISGALTVPLAMQDAIHRYGAERRSASYFVLAPTAAGDIPAPSEADLKAFYEERKATFRAPEYRSVNVLALNAEALAQPDQVTEAAARQRYEQAKARFGTPERRTIQQISFPSAEEARAAAERIKQGTSFEALAQERNVSAADLELGTYTRTEMIDSAVADAAFALPENGVSDPVQGRFGPVLLRVTRIAPESVKPFEEVAADLRRELAAEKARATLDEVHDAVEDMRAGAKPLTEIAKEKNLALVTLPSVGRDGRDPAGQAVTVPERDAVLAAAFRSDVGADTEALRTRSGGYVWYEVAKIEPGRERSFDEVREDVAAQWRADAIARRLIERARALVERLEKGEAIEAVAAEAGAAPKTATDLTRNAGKDDLAADAVNRMFATNVGKAASVAGAGDTRIVFKVTAATVPPLVTSTLEAGRIADQLRTYLGDDLLAEYIALVQKDAGVQVNEQALRRAVGGEF
ncbi:MAG TPA: peptidyl-prolyl cis-trans isomerase [Beijerinckiaceae bacterium]